MNDRSVASEWATQYVTVMICQQLFGLPIESVHDIFAPEKITKVPLAGNDIAGVLNLRGRIVTAIDMRRRLGLSDAIQRQNMAVGIEFRGESYGLLIDSIGEVIGLADSSREANPSNMVADWAAISAGVHRLDNQLMIILDIDKLLGAMIEPA